MTFCENPRPSDTISAQLNDVQRMLEQADENENTLERTAQREALLELQDTLQAELIEDESYPEASNPVQSPNQRLQRQ